MRFCLYLCRYTYYLVNHWAVNEVNTSVITYLRRTFNNFMSNKLIQSYKLLSETCLGEKAKELENTGL